MTQLLLVGAGHAHLEVLRRFGRARPRDVTLEVVTLDRRHVYSGMVPGFLNGSYRAREIGFDVAALAARCGGRLRLGRAVRLDRERRRLELEDGSSVGYDLASFNLGSGAAGSELPGVREHALLLKPMVRVLEVRGELERAARSADPPPAVVGGGAAGVEIACSLAARAGRARLIESSARILSGYRERFRRLAERVLAERGVEVETGAAVAAVEAEGVVLESGERRACRRPVWLAGASAPPLFRRSGLTTDEAGFLLIDDSLRHVGDPRLFAAGDCATLVRYPETPKAGVYSVRQAPVLWAGLRAALSGASPPVYRPQEDFLSLLNTADGRALLSFRGLVWHGRLAWRLKDWIDRRFVRRYQRLYDPEPAA